MIGASKAFTSPTPKESVVTNNEELIALAERVEAATGPDRELDVAIEAVFTDERGTRPLAFFKQEIAIGKRRPLSFTASLDAAMSLVPEGLGCSARRFQDGHAVASVYVSGASRGLVHAATPALALTAACLRARASA